MSFCRLIVVLNSLAFVMFSKVSAKELAWSIDDAPSTHVGLLSPTDRKHFLLDSMTLSQLPETVFFLNSSLLTNAGLNFIKSLAARGHLIGNHNHRHFELNMANGHRFIQSLDRGLSLLTAYFGPIGWYRFPMLNEGQSREQVDELRSHLSLRSLRNAYVTVVHCDFMLNDVVLAAAERGHKINLENLKRIYLELIADSVVFYDQLAQHYLGRSPKHIMVLHDNDLTALFLPNLVGLLASQGWSSVAIREAYKDPIQNYLTKSVFKYNPGRIGEIAFDHGYRGPLIHKSCDPAYLTKRLVDSGVFL